MPTNGYESAYEQAKSEIISIEEELKRLHARMDLIDKLLECLSALIPSNESAATHDGSAAELSIVEAHPHEHHENQNHGYEHHEHHQEHEHHEHQHQG
jgi:hypothetical protein